MIYGGVAEEKISLNDITLWTGEPDRVVYSPDAYKSIAGIREALFREDYREADRLQRAVQGHYSQNYQPLGTLTISQSEYSDTSEYSRSLDIARALATVNYRGYSREYFASAPDSVMVVRMKGKKQNLTLGYHCQLPHQQVATVSKEGVAELTIDGYAAWTSKPNYAGGETGFQYDSNRGVHFRTIIRVLNQDGTVRVRNNDQLQLTDCTDCIIFIANATSFNGNDKDPVREGRDYRSLVRSRIDHAAAKTYDELLNRHEADYQSYFNRISLDLGTTAADIQAKTTEQQLRD